VAYSFHGGGSPGYSFFDYNLIRFPSPFLFRGFWNRLQYKNKIFILTNRGFLYKTVKGSNNWQLITASENDTGLTGNEAHYLNNRNCKAAAIKDNLLLVSWPFGSLSSFDMDSEVYTPVDTSLYPSTPSPFGSSIASDIISEESVTVGSRIYFVGESSSGSGKTLCWFDAVTKTFGYGKNPPSLIAERIREKADLATEGINVYMLVPGVLSATLL
jgi:hypothetical protein